MSDWIEYSFSELCDISRGASPRPIHNYISNEGMPWVKIADATSSTSKYINKTNQKIKIDGVSKSVHVFKGDLILSNSATPGLPKFMAIEACIHDGWMLLRNFKNITKDYAYWLLLNERNNLVRQGSGSVFVNLKTDILKNHRVKIPSLKHQNKVVGILNSLDDKIQLNNETNQTLEQIAQAIFKSWFIDFDPVHAKAHAHKQALAEGKTDSQAQHLANVQAMQVISGKTADELAHMEQIQPSDYAQLLATADALPSAFDDKGLPLGWEEMTADNLIEFNPKEKLPKGTLSTYFDMASIPIKGCTPESPIKRDFSSGTKFQNNDTLLARITPCLQNGKTAYIQGLMEGEVAWGSTEFIVMRAKNGIPKPYSYILARYEGFRTHAIQSMTGTSGRQRAQVDVVKHFKVVNPNCAEIWLAFSKVIQPMFNLIFTNSQQNIYLAKARDTLLPKLLSGEIEV